MNDTKLKQINKGVSENIEVIFNFTNFIGTNQKDIVVHLPINHVPKKNQTITFDFDLEDENIENYFIVEKVIYEYGKKGLIRIEVLLSE